MKIYNVIYGNYFPREIDSSWSTEQEARDRVEELDREQEEAGIDSGMWGVEEIEL